MPSLILVKAPGGAAAGQSHPLAPAGTSFVGRDADQCQVVIPHSSVSRRHAVITADAGRYVLEDLGSRNGTYVNQTRMAGPTRLKSDDRIKICDFLFQFHDETALADEPPGDDQVDMTTVRQTVSLADAREFLEVAPSDRLRALLDISTGLSRTLDLGPLLPAIADSLFRVFRQADRCFVILLDDQGRMVAKVAKSLRQTPGGDAPQFSRTIVKKCLDSLQSYLSEDASADATLGSSQSIAEFRIRSVMCVPLVGGDGRPLGAMQLDAQDLAKKFRDDDLKLLTIVANIAAVAVEKAQAHAELLTREKERGEIEIARKVQAGFLPKLFPQLPGYDFFAFYSPAQSVGGDYYDFIHLPHGRVAVVLGDVAGKGVAAALLMAKLSAEVRFCFLTEPDPARAVTLLNDQLIAGGIGDRFVTFAALILDPTAHQVTVVNAGHINPLKLKPCGHLADVISNAESGLPLGIVEGYPYTAKVVSIDAGESLLMFTDGVTDAEDPADVRFTPAGVGAAVAEAIAAGKCRPPGFGDCVIQAVMAHADGRTQSDDIAFVCFGRVEPEAGGGSQVTHPTATGPATVRIPAPVLPGGSRP